MGTLPLFGLGTRPRTHSQNRRRHPHYDRLDATQPLRRSSTMPTAQHSRRLPWLDLTKTYFHILLAETSRPLTATITPWGLYQYCRLMGLTDSAAVFQRCVDRALAGIPGCIVYVDDVLIFSDSQAGHDATLRTVLQRLQQHYFRLNTSKCNLNAQHVTFLGNIISHGLVQMDPARLQGVRNMPNPTCAKQFQSFLGAVNYYEFLHKSADLIAPLQRLLRAKTPWVWGAEQQTAMDKIRDRLCQLPALHNFDPQRPTVVTTDASSDGLGATLSQLLDGKEVPIAYASHTLTSTERNYASNEREVLAVLWALEHWEHFLLGLHFQLRSDHRPLASLIQHTNARKREKFNFTFSYIPVSSNNAADCLSRLPTTSLPWRTVA